MQAGNSLQLAEGFGDGRFEGEHVNGCVMGDVSVFQTGDGLDYDACTARVSRVFWASTADVRCKRYEGITRLMK